MKYSLNKLHTPFIVILAGCVLLLVSFGIRHAAGLYMVPISEHLNSGREIFGLGVAINFLMIGFGSPLFGAIADKQGSGRAALYGVILLIIGLYMLSNVTNAFDVILSQAIFGLGSAGCGTAVVLGAVGKIVSLKNRTLMLGIVMAAGSLGQFLIVPLTGFLIELSSWSQSIIYLCFLASIMIIFSFGLRYADNNPLEETQAEQSLKNTLIEALQSKSYNLLTVGFFVCGFHVAFVATHFPAYLADLNMPIWIGAWSLAVIGLFNIFGTIWFGKMGDSKSKKNLLAILYFIRAIVFLVFIFMPKNEFTILLFAATLGILWLSTVPLTSGIISVLFGTRYMSFLYGFTFLSHQLGSFAGSWFGGRLYDYYGSYNIMWWICVFLGFVSAAIHLPIKEKLVTRIIVN